MDRQSQPAIAVWSAKVAAIVALAAAGLSPAPVAAQVKVRLQRSVAVPRFIRAQAAESAVINHVVLVFGDARIIGKGPAADDNGIEPPAAGQQRVILFSGSFDELVYGSDGTATDARFRLDNRLREMLAK